MQAKKNKAKHPKKATPAPGRKLGFQQALALTNQKHGKVLGLLAK